MTIGIDKPGAGGAGGGVGTGDIDGGEAESVYGGTDNIDSNGGAGG